MEPQECSSAALGKAQPSPLDADKKTKTNPLHFLDADESRQQVNTSSVPATAQPRFPFRVPGSIPIPVPGQRMFPIPIPIPGSVPFPVPTLTSFPVPVPVPSSVPIPLSVPVPAPVQGQGNDQYYNISYAPRQRMFHPSIGRVPQADGFSRPRIFPRPYHRYEAEGQRMFHHRTPPGVLDQHYHRQGEGVPPPYQAETPSTKRVLLTPEMTGIPLRDMIRGPVEYWFSCENLSCDEFLKSMMDEEGWVPISHIITFPGLNGIKDINCSLVAENMQDSVAVEVQMEDLKIRKRGDWFNHLPNRQN